MTKITIERETLRQLFNEMETVDYEFDPPERVLVMMDELRAALAQPPMVDAVQDIPLPEPDLEIGTKLLPYEDRQFNTPGMAARLGYTSNLRQYVKLETMRVYGDAREAAAVAKERERLQAGMTEAAAAMRAYGAEIDTISADVRGS